jgi:hypothetical protein
MLVLVTLRRSTSVTHLLGINSRSKEQGPGGEGRVRVVWYEHKNRYGTHVRKGILTGGNKQKVQVPGTVLLVYQSHLLPNKTPVVRTALHTHNTNY